jgi:hypothetical protein
MARKAAKAAPKPVEPEDESQDIEAQEALEATQPDEKSAPKRGRPPKSAAATSAKAEIMTKAEAVRRALAAGKDSPSEGVPYIRKEFRIEIAPQMFSAYKAQAKAREAKQPGAPKGRPGRKPRAAVEGYLAPPPPPKIEPTGEGDLLDALKAIKPLIAQYGADKVKQMVDLLG